MEFPERANQEYLIVCLDLLRYKVVGAMIGPFSLNVITPNTNGRSVSNSFSVLQPNAWAAVSIKRAVQAAAGVASAAVAPPSH